jgi:hypothetical protein
MAKQASEGQECKCPVYELYEWLHGKGKCSGAFVEHLNKARVEFLLAVRSLIDQRVEHLSRPRPAKGRARRIEVVAKE